MNNKSLATVQILDFLGNPIPKVQYEVKNHNTGQQVVHGTTNSKGCLYEIQRDKGTVLDVYVKSIFEGTMRKVQTFTMSKDRMLVKVISPKVLMDLKTVESKGSDGTYKRKTHVVKKGETLSEIAKQYHTTVRALERLNHIEDSNKISIGQVIKLPINIPANGNNASHDKSPASKIPAAQKKSKKPSEAAKQGKKEDKNSDAEISSALEDIQKRTLDQLNEWYEDGKKALHEALKIDIKEDRSQDGGTPKAEAPNLCKTAPQCISSGKSELIREVNIRLAGFGGALPTDKFTPLTAECIKQFQRDYMGVVETGKICGSVLVALDKFNTDYPIEKYMSAIACPCAKHGGGEKCNGFGANRTKQYKILGVEAPGMHRSTIWILKAAHFYLEKDKNLGVKITGISSGYRCIENNAGHNSSRTARRTVNHMSGAALDILISDSSKLKDVREKIFIKYMRAAPVGIRSGNRIFLESNGQGATSWVHFDILMYEDLDPQKLVYYGTSVTQIVNQKLTDICKKNNSKILSCGGFFPPLKNSSASSNLNNNIKAFLDTIAKSEGTFDLGESGYNVMVTGKLFKSYSDHPFTHSIKALHVSGNLYSTASGRYQIMRVNWYGSKENPKEGLKYQLGLNDFSPKSQDIAAIALLKRRKAYTLIVEGKINTAFSTTSLNKEWASFPGAGYNQKEHKIGKILNWYKSFGGNITD